MISLNMQPPESQELRNDEAVEVVDVFHTLQGEGPFVGKPAVFIRLAGCNLQCPDCDTNYTSNRRFISSEALVDEVKDKMEMNTKLVVITGGEPFRQNIAPLVRLLSHEGFKVQIETNGTLYPKGDFPYYANIYIICSPKGIVPEPIRPYINALKYIVEDGLMERGFPTRVLGRSNQVQLPWEGFRGEIYLQPADCEDKEQAHRNMKTAAILCLKHGHRLSLQTHKILGLA